MFNVQSKKKLTYSQLSLPTVHENRLFYRTTVFAARCCANAAYAVARCLSFCLSVTFVYSVETSKYIFTIFFSIW